LVFTLRKNKFDLLLNLSPGLKNSRLLLRDKIFFYLCGIKKQVVASKNRNIFDKTLHESDFLMKSLSEIGLNIQGAQPKLMNLQLGEEDWKEYNQWEESKKIQGKQCIAVSVGSKMQSKRWDLDNYKNIVRLLIIEMNIFPVLVGGSEDIESAEYLLDDWKIGVSACGKLSVRAAACCMTNCIFYLGNDTGTMHLAVAAGIPCVAIFSARDVPGKWYPYGQGHFVHRVPVECEGCMLYECFEQKRKCLTLITPEAVLESCREILNRESNEVPLVEVTDQERRVFEYPNLVEAAS
jgi:heptosyltransferase III